MGTSSKTNLRDMSHISGEKEESARLITALRQVVTKAIVYDGISCGFNESVRAISRGSAQLCILVASCDDPSYCKVAEALCQKHRVNTILVEDAITLGQLCGSFKSKRMTDLSKIGRCSC